MENMTDKQYEGILKDSVHALDRIAKVTTDETVLKAIYEERNNFIDKLGYPMDEHNLYNSIK